MAVFGCLGAKLLYVLENYDYVSKNGISFGGMSFFGTVRLMPIVVSLMAVIFRKKGVNF